MTRGRGRPRPHRCGPPVRGVGTRLEDTSSTGDSWPSYVCQNRSTHADTSLSTRASTSPEGAGGQGR